MNGKPYSAVMDSGGNVNIVTHGVAEHVRVHDQEYFKGKRTLMMLNRTELRTRKKVLLPVQIRRLTTFAQFFVVEDCVCDVII